MNTKHFITSLFIVLSILLMIGCTSSRNDSDYNSDYDSDYDFTPAATDPLSNVIVNNVRLDDDTLHTLAVQYGITIQDGVYWYDNYSGAWGYVNEPTFGFVAPNLNIGGRLAADASGGQTGVYLNGRELPLDDLFYLESILGPIPYGRYWLDPYGNMGVEGYAAEVNIIAMQTAMSNTSATNPYQTPNDDFIMAAGNCTIAPDGVIC